MDRFVVYLVILIIVSPAAANGSSSDWISAPKPKFPAGALEAGSEGSVKLQVVLAENGHVTNTTVIKSSGDPVLDAAAQKTVLKWRMNPSAVKPSDLTKGRAEIVEFKQEAFAGAAYPDRQAWFTNLKEVDYWMFAPFPSYPLRERQLHHTGTVLLVVSIDPKGRVAGVQVVHSSGYPVLDQSAVAAVRLWRAHSQYGGKKFKLPINFVMGSKRS